MPHIVSWHNIHTNQTSFTNCLSSGSRGYCWWSDPVLLILNGRWLRWRGTTNRLSKTLKRQNTRSVDQPKAEIIFSAAQAPPTFIFVLLTVLKRIHLRLNHGLFSRRCIGSSLKIPGNGGKSCSIPTEHLNLARKVGDGILKPTLKLKKNPIKAKRNVQLEKYIKRCIMDTEKKSKTSMNWTLQKISETTAYCEYTMTVVNYYNCIHEKLKFVNRRLEKQERNKEKQVLLPRTCQVSL